MLINDRPGNFAEQVCWIMSFQKLFLSFIYDANAGSWPLKYPLQYLPDCL
jgi:hypothetical protein